MSPENELVLRDTQNWASRSHRELYDSVHHNNDPGQAGELGSEWAQFGTELTESAQLISKRVAASESGWTGEAAEGARAAIRGNSRAHCPVNRLAWLGGVQFDGAKAAVNRTPSRARASRPGDVFPAGFPSDRLNPRTVSSRMMMTLGGSSAVTAGRRAN